MHIQSAWRELPYGRVLASVIDNLEIARREEQAIGLRTGRGIGRKEGLDVELKISWERSESRPSIEPGKGEIYQQVLSPLSSNLLPFGAASDTLNNPEGSAETTRQATPLLALAGAVAGGSWMLIALLWLGSPPEQANEGASAGESDMAL